MSVRVCVKVIRTRIVNDFPRFATPLAKFKFDADAECKAKAKAEADGAAEPNASECDSFSVVARQ